MNLCSDNHDEICFEGRDCPLCDAVAEKDKEIVNLENALSVLRSDIQSLESELSERQQ